MISPNGGSMGGDPSSLTKANLSKTNPTNQVRCPKVCFTLFLLDRGRPSTFESLGAFRKFVSEWATGL